MRRIVTVRTLLVWAIVWPLVTAMLVLIGWVGDDLPLAAKTLILTAILVPLISLVLGPLMHRLAVRMTE